MGIISFMTTPAVQILPVHITRILFRENCTAQYSSLRMLHFNGTSKHLPNSNSLFRLPERTSNTAFV